MAEPGALRRRSWILALLLLGVVGTALLWAAGPLLVREVVILILSRSGIEPTTLEVDAVGPRGIRIHSVRVGPEGGVPDLEVEDIALRFSPTSLLRGDLGRLEVRGLTLRVAIDESGNASFGSLDAVGGASAGSGPTVLPASLAVELEKVRIEATTPFGPIMVAASGHGRASQGRLEELELSASTGGPSDRATGSLQAQLAAGELAVEARAHLDGVGAIERLARQVPGSVLDARLTLEGKGRDAERGVFDPAGLSGTLQLGTDQDAALTVGFRVTVAPPDAASSPLSRDFELNELQVDARGWPFAPAEGLTMSIDELSASGSGRLEPFRFEGQARLGFGLDGAMSDDLRIADASAETTPHIILEDERLELSLPESNPCLSIRFARLHLSETTSLLSPSPICLTLDAPIVIRRSEGAPPEITGRIGLRAAPFSLEGAEGALVRGTWPDIEVDVAGDPESGQAAVRTSGGRLLLLEDSLELDDVRIETTARWGAPPDPEFHLTIGRLRQLPEPAVVALAADVRGTLDAEALRFRGTLENEAAQLSIEGEGLHAFGSGQGSVALRLAPLRFAPEALQPRDAFPIIGESLEQVAGELAAALSARWTPEETTSGLEVGVREVSFEAAGVSLRGAEGRLVLDSLSPLRAPSGQRIRFEELDAGVPLTDGIVSFRVEPGPRLEIEHIRGKLAGGSLSAEGFVDLERDDQRYRFEIAGAELATLVAMAAVEGLGVEGAIDGRVPVTVDGQSVAIREASLHAAGGVIRYRPAQAPAHLRAMGAPGELVLEALKDFHYDGLDVRIDGDLEQDMEVIVRLQGRNPNVEGGRPFDLTLNLSGAVGPLLQTSRIGGFLVEGIRKRILERAKTQTSGD